MRVQTVAYEVYKYNELTDEAKKKVKQWYLDGQPAEFFTEDCRQDLVNLFGENDLEVQYSLGYCQGDGFNIYGKINAENIIDCLENHNGGTQLKEFEDVLTDKEKERILSYAKECGAIELPYNSHYCYSLADYIEVADSWDIRTKSVLKFEQMVRDIFKTLCDSYEEQGYNFFYEISDEDLNEACEANEYEFLADGTLF